VSVDRFNEFIDRVLEDEGGFTNNPKDPGNWTGGRVGNGKLLGTKFGIAANTYPNVDIPNLTREQAKAIYRRDWWDKLRLDRMPPMVAAMLLSVAINTGIGRASRWLQAAVGAKVDGQVGPATIGAVQATDPNDIGFLFLAEYLDFLNDLTTWQTFGRGWAQRVVGLLRDAAKDN
jgi:lysozyme family protein